MKKIFFMGKGQGNSMQPLINEGDKLFAEKVELENLRAGDVVVFYQNNNFVGHRVIKINNRQIITKGDNSLFFDKPLRSDELLGKVIKIEGKYGKISLSSFEAYLFSFYFLFYSLTTYYLPFWLRLFLTKILRGRKILVRFLTTS